MMKTRIINLSQQTAEAILPTTVSGMIGLKGTYVCGAFEGKNLLALAVVTDHHGPGLVINHIQKLGDVGNEAFEVLFNYIEDLSRDNYKRCISARLIDTPDNLTPLMDYFDMAGFMPMDLSGHFLAYTLENIKNTEFFDKIHTKRFESLISKVVPFELLEKEQKLEITEKIKSSSYCDRHMSIDNIFSRFYISKENEVIGYMNFNEDRPGVLVLKDVYLERSKEAKYVIPGILASVIMIMEMLFKDDSLVLLPINISGMYKGIKVVFGEGILDLNIFEFAKIL